MSRKWFHLCRAGPTNTVCSRRSLLAVAGGDRYQPTSLHDAERSPDVQQHAHVRWHDDVTHAWNDDVIGHSARQHGVTGRHDDVARGLDVAAQ